MKQEQDRKPPLSRRRVLVQAGVVALVAGVGWGLERTRRKVVGGEGATAASSAEHPDTPEALQQVASEALTRLAQMDMQDTEALATAIKEELERLGLQPAPLASAGELYSAFRSADRRGPSTQQLAEELVKRTETSTRLSFGGSASGVATDDPSLLRRQLTALTVVANLSALQQLSPGRLSPEERTRKLRLVLRPWSTQQPTDSQIRRREQMFAQQVASGLLQELFAAQGVGELPDALVQLVRRPAA